MANKIFMSYDRQKRDGKEESGKVERVNTIFPLINDVVVEVGSDFTSFGEMIPRLSNLINLATSALSIGGSISEGLLNLQNKLDVPKWNKTEPLKFNINLAFFANERGAFEDVWRPVTDLCNLTILLKDKGTFKTPGVSLANIGKVGEKLDNENKEKLIAKSARLVDIYIPGMFYLPGSLIETARPTFSKERTTSGYPLWATLDMQCRSLVPANNTMWDSSRRLTDAVKKDGKYAGIDTFENSFSNRSSSFLFGD